MQELQIDREIITFFDSLGCDAIAEILGNCRANRKRHGKPYLSNALLQRSMRLSIETGDPCFRWINPIPRNPSVKYKNKEDLIGQLRQILKEPPKLIDPKPSR